MKIDQMKTVRLEIENTRVSVGAARNFVNLTIDCVHDLFSLVNCLEHIDCVLTVLFEGGADHFETTEFFWSFGFCFDKVFSVEFDFQKG